VEQIEHKRKEHAETQLTVEERINLARLRNSMECLRMVHAPLTQEATEKVYSESLQRNLTPASMLLPDNVIQLTAHCRST
jgi:hypothetical protein